MKPRGSSTLGDMLAGEFEKIRSSLRKEQPATKVDPQGGRSVPRRRAGFEVPVSVRPPGQPRVDVFRAQRETQKPRSKAKSPKSTKLPGSRQQTKHPTPNNAVPSKPPSPPSIEVKVPATRTSYKCEATSAAPTPSPPPGPEVFWADLSKLKITSSSAPSKPLDVAVEAQGDEGDYAIIGFDFGTAFTKAVVRFRSRDYAVDWSEIADLEEPHLIPSCFSEHLNGTIVLGARSEQGWRVHSGIKMPLLESSCLNDLAPEHLQTAVLFISASMRYVQHWFRHHVPSAMGAEVKWRLHLGLPSRGVDDARAELFLAFAARSFALATGATALDRERASR